MTDRKPPRHTDDERTTLLALLRYQRESVVRKVDGIDEAAARSSPLGSGTSVLWLVKHLGIAESLWIERRFAGRRVPLPDAAVGPGDTLPGAVAAYRDTWDRVDAVVAGADMDDLCQDTGTESPVTLRWVLMHLLEETARHAGHLDVLCELIDGRTGR